MATKDNTLNAKMCVMCKQNVVDAVFCKICSTPYHPGCANRTTLLSNGGYSKCCRPKSPLPQIQTDSNTPASSQERIENQSITNDSIESIINKAIRDLQVGLDKNFSIVSRTINEVSSKVDNMSLKVDEVVTTVTDHSERIAVIEGTLENLHINSLSRNCLSEIQDRLSRSRYLILFGLVEDKNNKSNEHSKENISITVTQLFSKFSTLDLLENLKTFRIGSFTQTQQHPRPVKIICSSEERARLIHKAFLEAKKDDALRHHIQNMRLSKDMTKMQVEEVSQLRKELELRQQAGEMNTRLVFRNGVPSIVSPTLQRKPRSNLHVSQA